MKLKKRAVSFLTLVAFLATCFVFFPGSSLTASASTPSNIYYAVDAQRNGGQVYHDGSGCSDKGQIAYFNQVGQSLTFTVNAQTKRTYCLAIRYSCGADNQKMTLSVNDKLTTKLNFKYTGTWGESWRILYKSINLDQGQNKIVIRIGTGDGSANFDYIMLDTDNGEKTPNDLSDDIYFPGIGNQARLGSCVTYSRVHTIYSYMVSRVNNLTQPMLLSPKWVYNRIGGYDKIHKILTENGCATLLDDPYPTDIEEINYNYPWNVEESTAKNALKYRLDPNYGDGGQLVQHETTNSVNVIKNHIDNGRPISVTANWPSGSEPFNWIWADNKDAVVAANKTGTWWHQIAIVGYDDDYICTYNNKTLQGAVKVANQYGDKWERSGYIWVMYDALNAQSAILPETNGDRTSFFGHNGENEFTTYQALPSSAPELTATVHVNTNDRSSFQVSFTGSSPNKEDKTITPYLTDYNDARGLETNQLSPVQTKGLADVVDLSAGDTHSVALKGDGTVWTWGNNGNGQLGDGTTTARTTPVQAKGLTGVIALSAGYRHTMALKGDGTVWAWGSNSKGQLGNGTTDDQVSPVQITALSNVSAISGGELHSMALKKDGTVWSWGNNSNGQLGNGNTTSRTTPAQISGLSGVTAISGSYRHSMALKNDGTVWAWGNNGSGRLGDGTEINRLEPVQASGLTGIRAISSGNYHNMALKSNGSVYTWGYNDSGQIGNGTKTNQLLPTIVSVG